ncbi:MAG: ABC transporter ATP-binding protein [Candidatus Tectomicrobia bacterium]
MEPERTTDEGLCGRRCVVRIYFGQKEYRSASVLYAFACRLLPAADDMIRILLRLYALYAVFPGRLILAVLCTLSAVSMGLAVPWILKEVLDYGLAQGRIDFLYRAGGLLVAIALLSGAATYGQHYLGAYLAQHLAYRLRNLLYDHMQHLGFAYHDRTQTGELMSRATADVEAVRLFFHFGLPTIVSLVLTGVGTLLAMAWLDWRLALVAVVSLPLFLGVALGLGHLLRPLQLRVQERTADLAVALQESLAGIRVVKAFAREPLQIERFRRAATALYRAYLQVTHMLALHLPLLTLLLSLAIALTLYIGGKRVVAGAMSLGTLVAATGYLAQLAQPLRRLSWLTGMASRCQAGGERLFEVLDAVAAVQEQPQAQPLHHLQGTVRFEQVSFHYTAGVPVLHQISFTAAPGQVIALLGSTGSGKTTIAQLIPRFYDVSGGRITLDGHDIRELQLTALRQHIGIIMQDTLLFSTTIRDNIAYGRDDLSLEAIIAAAKAARAHDFIQQFPEGYNTWVGERGVTLSGGQQQRLAIARACVRNPRILILDDATSSVDMETEWLIQQALAELMAGRTTLVIAHRLRTLKQADTILVLERGSIVQRGTHDELVAQAGLYRRIYDLQLRDQEAFVVAPRLRHGVGARWRDTPPLSLAQGKET